MGINCEIKLQVQIATFGQEGLERIISHNHPVIPGVIWHVSLQDPTRRAKIPNEIISREDFTFEIHYDKGLARNRNHCLNFPCDSPYVLLSDDDVDYNSESILNLIDFFEKNSDIDLICCRYTCNGEFVKPYGKEPFSLNRPLKGWYPTTFEIAFRRNSSRKLCFNEHLGIGSEKIIAGEDTIWVVDLLKNGAKGIFLPLTLCEHNGETTSERFNNDPKFYFALGALSIHENPLTWWLRIFKRGFKVPIPYFLYLKNAFSGALYAYRHKIFKKT